MVTKKTSTSAANGRKSGKAIVNSLQVYDAEKFGFPLAEFSGKGQFQSIHKGDTMDGAHWPHINGHRKYAKVYRVMSVRHTIQQTSAGAVGHLVSVFVEPAV